LNPRNAQATVAPVRMTDLAEAVILEEHVTLVERVTLLTHTNVEHCDHPPQTHLPSVAAPIVLRRGAFVGTCATLLPGVEVGKCAIVVAGAVVDPTSLRQLWSAFPRASSGSCKRRRASMLILP
jgi:carbonic anhydrase/acetyltransferase-like protein (isoleucine patch superfamily)